MMYPEEPMEVYGIHRNFASGVDEHESKRAAIHNAAQHSCGTSAMYALHKMMMSHYFDVITTDSVHRHGCTFQAVDHGEGRLHCVYTSDVGSKLQRSQRYEYDLILSMGPHHHLMHYHGCTESRQYGIQVLTTEYCLKGTCRTLLERTSNGLSTRHALKFVHSLLSTLCYAHKHGIAHTNVSLDNMCLNQPESLRLRGFRNGHFSQHPPTEYFPPEYDASVHTRDFGQLKAADSWATGIVFLQLLCKLTKKGSRCTFTDTQNGMRVVDVRAMISSNATLRKLSPLCKLLLSALLEIQPEKRIQCEDALSLCDRIMKCVSRSGADRSMDDSTSSTIERMLA